MKFLRARLSLFLILKRYLYLNFLKSWYFQHIRFGAADPGIVNVPFKGLLNFDLTRLNPYK
jgi:hypothetical protein